MTTRSVNDARCCGEAPPARLLSDLGVASGGGETGGAWSESTKVVLIADRHHFHNTRRYILDHSASGAVVWSSDRSSGAP